MEKIVPSSALLFILLRFMILNRLIVDGALIDEDHWYKGCFKLKYNSGMRYFDGDLNQCSKTCANDGYMFLAIDGGNCFCVNDSDIFLPVSAESCNIRCEGVPDRNLPCGGGGGGGGRKGGGDAWSVYSSSGPYVNDLQSIIEARWIEPSVPTSLKATVFLRQFVDIREEPLIEPEWENTLELLCRSELSTDSMNITANSSRESALCTLTFPRAGTFYIQVRVRNLLSEIHQNVSVTVVVPKPRELQVNHLNEPWTLPSCILPLRHIQQDSSGQRGSSPARIDLPWRDQLPDRRQPVVAVFANTTCLLELSVSTGHDLTFELRAWDGRVWRGFERLPPGADLAGPCEEPCRRETKSFVFKTTGIYTASARVSNDYGSMERNITIVVLDEHIRDVDVRLVASNPSLARTHKWLLFHLTAITADRHSTSIRVDFRDGIVKTAAVKERQNNISPADKSVPTLFASYTSGCNLSLQFDHVYETEGVFSPLVTLYNNVSSMTVSVLPPITVLREISGIKIRSDPFGPVGTYIPFLLTYTSMSKNVSVFWTVYNESGFEVESKKTSSLGTAFQFSSTGRFKVTCTVSNLLGSDSTSSFVVILQPIGDVSMSCKVNPYIEIEQEFHCIAVVESGTDFSFHWDFQENSKLTRVEVANRTSRAEHLYLYPGVYNVGVKVSNALGGVTRSLSHSVHVEIPIECLNVVTESPSVPGKSVNIMASATRGTSLTFDLDVGEGRKLVPQEVDTSGDVTIFSVGWNFARVGVHRVTVFAYNHISSASRTVDVHVMEMPPEFRVHVLPAPLPSFRTLVARTLQGEPGMVGLSATSQNPSCIAG